MVNKYIVISSVLLLLTANVYADEEFPLEQDGNSWVNLQTFHQFNDQWKLNLSSDVRFTDNSSSLKRSRVRSALFYKPSHWQFAIGYDHIRSLDPRSQENRLWQQASICFDEYDNAVIDIRFRQEQRFFSVLDDPIWRSRLRINGIFDVFENKAWYFRAWNELFINLNPSATPTQGHFAQFRAFAGIGHRQSKDLRLEAGYQMRYYSRSEKHDRIDHILFLQAYLYW